MNHSLIAPRRTTRRRSRPPVLPPPLPREYLEQRIQELELTIAQLQAENAILRAGFGHNVSEVEQKKSCGSQLERNPDLTNDSVLALNALGVAKSDAQRRVQAVTVSAGETVEAIVKACLKK